MKKKLLLSNVLFLVFGFAHAQIGINTSVPLQVFHIDGAKDNPPTGTPTPEQQLNDVVITKEGKMGIGTITPTTSLEINSPTAGAIKIKDGTQGAGKYLTSDDEGLAKWTMLNAAKSVILGEFDTTYSVTVPTAPSTILVKSGVKIKNLTRGRWIINFGGTFSAETTSRTWTHVYLSEQEDRRVRNNFQLLGPAGASTSFAGIIHPKPTTTAVGNHNTLSFISGSIAIDVNVDKIDNLYIVLENLGGGSSYTFATNAYENYLYAVPVNQ